MRAVVPSAAIAFLVQVSFFPVIAVGGPSVSDSDLNITVTLPDGFERIPDFHPSPEFQIRHAFRRTSSNASVTILIERLNGVMDRTLLGDQEAKRLGAKRYYRAKWKSFEVEAIVVEETVEGIFYLTHNVQIPTKPYAIQLKVGGPAYRDAELAEVTRALLASLDGPSNWLTAERRAELFGEWIAKMVFWMVAIGAAVYGLSARRTSVFRKRAIDMGLVTGHAGLTVRPNWAWYLLGSYLIFAGFVAGMFVAIGVARANAEHRGAAASVAWADLVPMAVGVLAGSAVTAIVMWRRVRSKRRILASLRGLTGPSPVAEGRAVS